MNKCTQYLILLALVAPAASAAAQSASAATAYIALVSTPTAGLSPTPRQWMLDDPRKGIGADMRWGHLSAPGGHMDTFTGGVLIPFAGGRADVGLSAGPLAISCDGCDGAWVGGAEVEGRILQSRASGGLFTLGIGGKVGFSKPSGVTVWSASLSAPLSLAFGAKDRMHVVPFITPGFGYGHASGGGESESGVRFLLGGGIGLMKISPGVGAQKIFINGGKIVFGAGITLNGA